MDLRKTVNEIRGRVTRETVLRSVPNGANNAIAPLHDEIGKLVLSYEQLYSMRNSVGRMPPSPNSFRARIGGMAVRIVQRLLFWYTPQVNRFNNGTIAAVESVCSAMKKQLAVANQFDAELAAIRSEMRMRRAPEPPVGDPGSVLANRDPGFDHFLFTLRNSLLGTVEERTLEMRQHLSSVLSLTPAIPAGPWLDLGCGRGDWLQAVQSTGGECLGVDNNLAAISYCGAQGLRVIDSDPLVFLRNAADSTYSLISAFHAVNRYPARDCWRLVQEVSRALKPGGLFLLESANPASLLAGSEDVWYDPAALRPLPLLSAKFLLDYFGLDVVLHRALRSDPEEIRVPLAELEFVRQLNSHLYGPRAYALIARRPAVARGVRGGQSLGQPG
jgi:SAM-dependent methyltransferase